MARKVYQWGQLAKDRHLVDPKYGVTFRKLDYWTRQGHLGGEITKRPGSGITRRWTWEEVQLALAIGALTEVGFTLAKAVQLAPRVLSNDQRLYGSDVVPAGDAQLGLFISIAFDAPKEPER